MIKVNIHEAKTHLSQLLRQARSGEQVVICERNEPVAELKPLEPDDFAPRRLGGYRGKIVIQPGCFDPQPDEELRALYGEDAV